MNKVYMPTRPDKPVVELQLKFDQESRHVVYLFEEFDSTGAKSEVVEIFAHLFEEDFDRMIEAWKLLKTEYMKCKEK